MAKHKTAIVQDMILQHIESIIRGICPERKFIINISHKIGRNEVVIIGKRRNEKRKGKRGKNERTGRSIFFFHDERIEIRRKWNQESGNGNQGEKRYETEERTMKSFSFFMCCIL